MPLPTNRRADPHRRRRLRADRPGDAPALPGAAVRSLRARRSVRPVARGAPGGCAERYGARTAHQRWEEMISEPLDAVLVAATGDHAPVAIAAAEAGLHVFVEKSMALCSRDGERMVAAAGRAGVTLMVGTMKRYDPAYERLVELLPSISRPAADRGDNARVADRSLRRPPAPDRGSRRHLRPAGGARAIRAAAARRGRSATPTSRRAGSTARCCSTRSCTSSTCSAACSARPRRSARRRWRPIAWASTCASARPTATCRGCCFRASPVTARSSPATRRTVG